MSKENTSLRKHILLTLSHAEAEGRSHMTAPLVSDAAVCLTAVVVATEQHVDGALPRGHPKPQREQEYSNKVAKGVVLRI